MSVPTFYILKLDSLTPDFYNEPISSSIDNDEEYNEVDALVQNVCKCQNISVNEVVSAVKNGADTVEKVMKETKAGTGCGRCKGIINNIIENKK